jgi:hypothetical protein
VARKEQKQRMKMKKRTKLEENSYKLEFAQKKQMNPLK